MPDKEIISCQDDLCSENSAENKEKQDNCQIKEIEDHYSIAESSTHSKKESSCEESDNSCGCGCSEVSNENKENHKHDQHREHYDCDERSDHTKEKTDDSCSCGCEDTYENEHNTCEVESTHHACGCGCSEGLLEKRESLWTRKNLFVMITSAVLLPVGLYFNYFTGQEIVSEILFLAVIALSGYEIIKSGIMGLLKGNFSINLLMTIAVAVSFAIGSGAEGAVIIFLFYIAEFLENYAGNRARKSIESLLKLAPDTATIKINDKNIELNVNEVKVDDILVVRPGEKISLDGIVINGESTVDQAAITGESIPVNKTEGDNVFAATLNGEGYLEVKVTKKSDETVLSKIINLVRESQQKKSITESFIERFAKYYTPAVVLIAAAIATVPPFVFGQPLYTWIYRALVLLVISCPCAFLLSTPVAMVSGITASTRNGVLIKGSKYVEEMKNISTIVFDKTGTITEGKLEVTDVLTLNNYSKNEILQIAGSLESRSKHPLAEAVINYVEESNMDFKEVKDFKSITGNGVKGRIDGKMFYIGKKSLFKDNPEFPEELINKLQNDGKTIIILGNDDHILAVIGLMDRIRGLSKSTIAGLKERSIKTVMLTGDNEGTAKAVSTKIGIDKYYSGLLPEDKVKIIDELLNKGECVAMIGDGVNDAPALARANVGIAMGAAGSDVAIETADIALMQDDISKINYLIDLSRKTMSVVKQNVSAALLIQLALAALAVFGFVSLWVAVTFGDVGLTLAVILNALQIGIKNKNDAIYENEKHDLNIDYPNLKLKGQN
ncbi:MULTISPECIES: heavy metal translocating P-type ATPase [Methanobacterium]|uniref:Cation-translocating P-type ATPase n=1 Tax=Methanobacterium veterum TaxID=408577 RepID=A0A9E5A7U4_9EURY|nr:MULTISPECIES: cation-translocating P-type ATPase [Methanobacterium]MCZ3366713.1 cation-translocating P-type ATPase [Methanobacterium veterum]MCZ3374141.1 cation-translocating P-type ATPase [Methanobacterium veterum]